MRQEIINNYYADPSILFGIKCLAVLLIVMFTAWTIEHYLKPKSALEQLLKQAELEASAGSEFITANVPVYRTEQWR